MSDLGQKRKRPGSRRTSVLPSGADTVSLPRHARLVPNPEVDHLVEGGHSAGSDASKANEKAPGVNGPHG
jgi:hypothetical protein